MRPVQGILHNNQGQRIRTLPGLLIRLRGQVALDVRAQSSVNQATGALVTTFSTIPGAAVSKFTLQITGRPTQVQEAWSAQPCRDPTWWD
jgi:hypothetical protein